MSKTTKRKHVTREVLDDFVLPEGEQQIVKICAGRGNNLHEVITAGQVKFLVSMPKKFRKNVWIKRGDFVIIEPIEEGCKVKAEIVRILYPQQVKYIQKEGKWPPEFFSTQPVKTESELQTEEVKNGADDSDGDSIEDDDSDLFINTNHPAVVYYSDSSSEEDEPEQDKDDDDDKCR